MKTGDLVKMKAWVTEGSTLPKDKTYIITWSGQWHVHLHGFNVNQVHSKDHLEVVSKA